MRVWHEIVGISRLNLSLIINKEIKMENFAYFITALVDFITNIEKGKRLKVIYKISRFLFLFMLFSLLIYSIYRACIYDYKTAEDIINNAIMIILTLLVVAFLIWGLIKIEKDFKKS